MIPKKFLLQLLQRYRTIMLCDADMAQLVEHHLAKVRVAGSNPVVRSIAFTEVGR